METHELTPYAVSIIAGCIITIWMFIAGEPTGKSIGGGLMIGSALFLFVGFFAKPKYQYGMNSLLFRVEMVRDQLLELDEPPHHKEVLAQRVIAGVEEFPTKPRMLRMTKDELIAFAEGMGVETDGTKEEIAVRLHTGED
jgi:hypothetical protein